MTVGRRALWAGYVLSLVATGAGRTIEKIASDTGGVASRWGPALVGLIMAAGVVAHCTAGDRLGRPAWSALLALAALTAAGLIALEASLLTVASAPIRVHALVVSSVALLTPALCAFGRRSLSRKG